MKVDWDKIIKENHTPSRESRRLGKMVGGKNYNPLDMPLIQGFMMLTGLDVFVPPKPPGIGGLEGWSGDPRDLPMPVIITEEERLLREEQERLDKEESRQRILETNRAKAINWLRTSEIPKEIKQQEEEYRLGRENETRALLLRNEQNRKADAARLLARHQATTAQSAARVQAAQQGATNVQGYLEKIQAVAAASAATRAQNLQSLQTLATQKAAASAAEAEQQKAIQANSAQVLAQQNAEVARLRAEAMAKQAQLAKAPVATAPAPVGRRGKAPQVKFGGSKASGYVQKLIELDKLDPEAELFDADLIQDPSKYIQTNLYEKSTRVRQGIKKIKEIQKKNIVTKALKGYAQRWKTLFNVSIDDVTKFATSWKRDGVEGVTYKAQYLTGQLMFLYLMKKYNNDALIVEYNKNYGSFEMGLFFDGKKLTRAKHIKKDILEAVEEGKELIIIPLSLMAKGSGHANMIIYRPKLNTAERFEPHGYMSALGQKYGYGNKEINSALDKFFKEDLKIITAHIGVGTEKPPFRYLPPHMLYEHDELLDGFQALENDYQRQQKLTFPGFCQAWGYYYMELCLKFPNVDGATLVEKANNGLKKQGGPKRFLEHILGYIDSFKKEINALVSSTTSFQAPEFNFPQQTVQEEAKDWNFFRTWYNDQLVKIMTPKRKQRYLKTGAGIIPTE